LTSLNESIEGRQSPTLTPRALFVIATAALSAFVALRWAVATGGRVVAMDHHVLRWVLAHREPLLTTTFRAITSLGDVRAVVAVGAFGVGALIYRQRRDLALVLVLSSAGTWLFVNGVKLLVQRPRPPEAVRLVTASGWSFPSGHAGQGAAMYLAIGVLVVLTARGRATQIAALAAGSAAALLIGVSRIYLGVHWTSDVIAGWSLAIAWLAVLLAAAACRRRQRTSAGTCSPTSAASAPSDPSSRGAD